MNLRELLYWLGHGFPLHRAWNLARDPRAMPTPAWQVYTGAVIGFAAALGVAAFFVYRATRSF